MDIIWETLLSREEVPVVWVSSMERDSGVNFWGPEVMEFGLIGVCFPFFASVLLGSLAGFLLYFWPLEFMFVDWWCEIQVVRWFCFSA